MSYAAGYITAIFAINYLFNVSMYLYKLEKCFRAPFSGAGTAQVEIGLERPKVKQTITIYPRIDLATRIIRRVVST